MELLFYIILFILSYILSGSACFPTVTMTPTSGPLNGSTTVTWSSKHPFDYIYIEYSNYVLYNESATKGAMFTMPPWQPSFSFGNFTTNVVFQSASHSQVIAINNFTYLAPTISLNPNNGNYQSITKVVITGDNFANDFNGTGVVVNFYLNSNFTYPLPITSTSKKTVTFYMPSGELGTTTITLVVGNNVTDTATATFSYI